MSVLTAKNLGIFSTPWVQASLFYLEKATSGAISGQKPSQSKHLELKYTKTLETHQGNWTFAECNASFPGF